MHAAGAAGAALTRALQAAISLSAGGLLPATPPSKDDTLQEERGGELFDRYAQLSLPPSDRYAQISLSPLVGMPN